MKKLVASVTVALANIATAAAPNGIYFCDDSSVEKLHHKIFFHSNGDYIWLQAVEYKGALIPAIQHIGRVKLVGNADLVVAPANSLDHITDKHTSYSVTDNSFVYKAAYTNNELTLTEQGILDPNGKIKITDSAGTMLRCEIEMNDVARSEIDKIYKSYAAKNMFKRKKPGG